MRTSATTARRTARPPRLVAVADVVRAGAHYLTPLPWRGRCYHQATENLVVVVVGAMVVVVVVVMVRTALLSRRHPLPRPRPPCAASAHLVVTMPQVLTVPPRGLHPLALALLRLLCTRLRLGKGCPRWGGRGRGAPNCWARGRTAVSTCLRGARRPCHPCLPPRPPPPVGRFRGGGAAVVVVAAAAAAAVMLRVPTRNLARLPLVLRTRQRRPRMRA